MKVIEKTKTEKMAKKRSEEYFFHERLFDSVFSLVYFSRPRYILARKMRHNARQSDNNNYYHPQWTNANPCIYMATLLAE